MAAWHLVQTTRMESAGVGAGAGAATGGPGAGGGELRLARPRQQRQFHRALNQFHGVDRVQHSVGKQAAVQTGVAGQETSHGFPKSMAGAAVSHLSRKHKEHFVVLEVGEDGSAQHDKRTGVRAEGIGVPLGIARDIHIGHTGQPKNARSQDRWLPHIGQLLRAQANAVECRFDPRTAHLVGDGAHDRVERGNLLQSGHRLAVLCPQKGRAIELVTGKQRTQPSALRADILREAQANPVAAAELADGRWAARIRRWY